MKRREFLKNSAGIAIGLSVIPTASCRNTLHRKSGTSKQKPNVVFIITDDQSWDSLGYTGGDVHTPRIDRMGREGIVFNNANMTSTVCSPSRYSCLTGRYAGRCEGPSFMQLHPWKTPTQIDRQTKSQD